MQCTEHGHTGTYVSFRLLFFSNNTLRYPSRRWDNYVFISSLVHQKHTLQTEEKKTYSVGASEMKRRRRRRSRKLMHNHIEGGLAVAGKCIHTNIRFGSKVLRKNVRACLDK